MYAKGLNFFCILAVLSAIVCLPLQMLGAQDYVNAHAYKKELRRDIALLSKEIIKATVKKEQLQRERDGAAFQLQEIKKLKQF